MRLTSESPMPWGKKYHGTKMANIPIDYLEWAYSFIVENNLNSTAARDVKIYIDKNRNAITKQIKKENGELLSKQLGNNR